MSLCSVSAQQAIVGDKSGSFVEEGGSVLRGGTYGPVTLSNSYVLSILCRWPVVVSRFPHPTRSLLERQSRYVNQVEMALIRNRLDLKYFVYQFD